MNLLQQNFIQQEKKLQIELHPSDVNFLIIKNCTFEKGSKLCAKYKASGMSSGKNHEDFQIGNFGKYY